MATDDDWQDGIISLWPTAFVQRRLPDHADTDRALIALIDDMERTHRNLTTDYRTPDLFGRDDAPIAWLRDHIQNTVIEYFRSLGIDYAVNWTLQGWPNVNRYGDYHDAHNHPRAYLSGTYYVKVPAPEEAQTRGRDDLRPGCITFYDPRPGINMTAIKGDPYVDPEYTLRPEAGTLLMWPAFINHFVHPNLAKSKRVSVSFNVVLQWSDDYLPDQG